jgi:hypothetical protein
MSRNPQEKPGKTAPAAARERRLAEALRANLKRRKAAARQDAPGNLPETGPESD